MLIKSIAFPASPLRHHFFSIANKQPMAHSYRLVLDTQLEYPSLLLLVALPLVVISILLLRYVLRFGKGFHGRRQVETSPQGLDSYW